MKRAGIGLAVVLVASTVVLSAQTASANDNDIFLSGLVIRCGTLVNADNPSLPCWDPTAGNSALSGDFVARARYKMLGYQLGVALAPKIMAPAESLGYNGFQLAVETSFTTIDRDTLYWTLGTERPTEGPGTFGGGGSSGLLHVTSIMARKGLPWGFEVAAGGSYLSNSEIVTGNLHVKWSIFEGFHDVAGDSPLSDLIGNFFPDIAVHGFVSRVLGTGNLDLTVAGFGVSASKAFGIAGMWSLTPYVGWQPLFVEVRSEVVDFTPEVSSGCVGMVAGGICTNIPDSSFSITPGKSGNNDVFQDESIVRWPRFYAGARIIYTHVSVVAEIVYTPGFTETVERLVIGGQEHTLKAKDQVTFSFAVAADF